MADDFIIDAYEGISKPDRFREILGNSIQKDGLRKWQRQQMYLQQPTNFCEGVYLMKKYSGNDATINRSTEY